MIDRDTDDYSIRWFNPADRPAFLSLHDEALSGGSDRWFEWKYLENPFVSHVPILVAESATGEFAGARPQVPMRMRAGDENVLVLRFGDTMVHPDHRRRGVFSSLTRRALDHYRSMSPTLCFNCPNDIARPGFIKAGGHLITDLPSFYRIQSPGSIINGDASGGVMERIGRTVAGGYLAARRARSSEPDNIAVVRHDGIPTDLLISLYEQNVPAGIHAVRDEPFLTWRYRNPKWEYVVHSASLGGRIVAALVTGRGTEGGTTVATIVDVLPLAGNSRRDRGIRALLDAVLPRYRDVDVIAYCGRSISRSILTSSGFLSDERLPLSALANPSRLVAYDLNDGAGPSWSVGGLDVSDPGAWQLTFTELDAR